MLKHVVSRKQRFRCFKLRNTLKTFLLAAVAIWLLYKLKCLHKKDAIDGSTATGSISQQGLSVGHGVGSLGRRGLQPWAKKTDLEIEKHGDGEGKESEDEDREVVEAESEALEELIDEEDKERGTEIEDLAIDEKGKQIEGASSEDHPQNESDYNH